MFQNHSDCSQGNCFTQQKYFEIAKNFKELTTEVQKAQARHNLGIGDEWSLKWGNIKGFIEEQKDLTQYLNNYKSGLDEKLYEHIYDTNNPHNVTKTQVGLSNVTNDAQVKRSEMGVAGGVATLDGDGKIPALQLPSDEEDVTVVDGKIKFKDRDTTNGMGYVILRKNKSFAEQVTKANTIYEIRYSFTLSKNITIPNNCVLKFEGGSISGAYTITGTNTKIIAQPIEIFGSNLSIAGTWLIPTIFASWFHNEDNVLKKVSKLLNGECYNKLIIDKDYNFDLLATDPEYTSSGPQDTNQGDNGLKIPSNTDVELNGTITITPNAYPCYHIIDINGGENISIKGSGSVIGDKYQHTYDSTVPWLGAQEWGNALYIRNAKNVLVDGIEFKETTGNGVVVDDSETVNITNCNIHHNRKLCISVSSVNNLLIIDNYLHDIGGDIQDTAQSCAIDIESESDDEPMYCSNIVIKDNLLKNINNPITIIPNNGVFDRIFIENNKFEGSTADSILIRTKLSDANVYIKNITIKDNQINWSVNCIAFDINYCEKCLIDNNIIYNTASFKIRYSDKVIIQNNNFPIAAWGTIELLQSNINMNNNFILSEGSSYILNKVGVSALGLENTEVTFENNIFKNLVFSDIQNKTIIKNNHFYGDQKQSTMIDGDVILKDNIFKISIESADYAIFDFNNSTKRQIVENNTFIFDAAMNKIFAKGYYTEINNIIIYNTTSNKNSVYGLFADKPNANNIGIGYKYFCTDRQTTEGSTNGIEIIHKGNNIWVDALGRIVS